MAATTTRKVRRGRAVPARRARKAKPRPSKAARIVVFGVDRYGGKGVATRRGRIVTASDDFAAIRRVVRELGIEDEAVLTRVPETGEYTL